MFDEIFNQVMKQDKLSKLDLKESLDLRKNSDQIFKAGEGCGKSGSFFFFSNDSKFLIKTILKSELHKFESMIEKYLQHILNTENQSIIARIYGIFKIKTNYFDDLYVMIMQNTSVLHSF